MKDVFVSYRRSDSSDVTGRIFDHLKTEFGENNLFRDVDSILKGEDFRKAIWNAIGQCKVLVVVIGQDWLAVSEETGRRRIDDPNDYVHLEISTALARGIPVIPVVVDNTRMPKAVELPPPLAELAFRNAASVRADPDFQHDIRSLCADIRVHIESNIPLGRTSTPELRNKRFRRLWIVGIVLLSIAAGFGIVFFGPSRLPPDSVLIGKWEQFGRLHDRDDANWSGRLRVIEVSRSGKTLQMRSITPEPTDVHTQVLSFSHASFDGKEWRFICLYADKERGSFRLSYVSDEIFEGTLIAGGDPAYDQRLVKLD